MDKVYNEDSIKRILALIRWRTNGLNELFKKEADEIAKEMDSEGFCDQANFIRAQFDEIPTFVPMEILDARAAKNEAAKVTKSFKLKRERANSQYVLNSIKEAIENGDLWTTVDMYRLTDETTEKLREAGYKVNLKHYFNIVGLPQAIIDWSGEDEA